MQKDGKAPTADETAEMMRSLGTIGAKAVEYTDYKLDTVKGDEKLLNNTETKRVAASRTAGVIVNGLLEGYRQNEAVRQQELNAQRNINQWIGTIQNEIDASGKSQADVETLAATMIYMKAMGASDMKLGKQVTAALAPDARNNAVDQIKNDPGFKEFAKQGKDKLIAMATEGRGDKLYQGFLKEKAAQMQKTKEAKQNGAHKIQNKLQTKAPSKKNDHTNVK